MHVVCALMMCVNRNMVLNVRNNGIWLKTLINRDKNKSVCFTTSLDNLAYSHKIITTAKQQQMLLP